MNIWRRLYKTLAIFLLLSTLILAIRTDTPAFSTAAHYDTLATTTCDRIEHLQTHIHMHLSVYIDNRPAQVPQGVGLGYDQHKKRCYYWLHTHDSSGILHIEAPAEHIFMLGSFLDIWTKQFAQSGYPPQLHEAGWRAYINGELYRGDLRQVPLQRHALVTLLYNSPLIQPDKVYNWPGNF